MHLTTTILEPQILCTVRDLFRYPDHFNLVSCENDLLQLLEQANDAGVEAGAELRKMLLARDYNLEELAVDYTSLFVNGFPRVKAHPFAGWYLGEKMIFGDISVKLTELYTRYGVSLETEHSLPADHIMVEMEFMSIMAEEYQDTGIHSYKEAMQIMLNSHMENWVFEFLQAIAEGAKSRYYCLLADILTWYFKQLNYDLKGVA